MRPPRSTGFVDDRLNSERRRLTRSQTVRWAGTLVVTGLVLALGCLSDPARTRGAGASAKANSKDLATAADDRSRMVALCREKLNKLQLEILDLGAQALGGLDGLNHAQIDDTIVNQRITVSSAEANYENGKLTREVAEIAVVEYTEGIYKQDEATLKVEALLAQNDFARAGDKVELFRDRLAKTKEASIGSPFDLATEYNIEDRIVEYSLREPRKRLESEKAQSKLDVFRQFAKAKRVKELQSEVEKARCEELAKRLLWERERSKLKKLHEARQRQDRAIHQERLRTLLGRAIAIAEQLKSSVDQADKVGEPGEQLRKEIADSADQLETLVEQARAEAAAAKWAKLKPKVHAAAVRYLGAQAK
jgi:hypothetical protein